MSTLRIKKRRRTFIGPILLIAVGLFLIILMIWQLSARTTAVPSINAPAVAPEIVRVELEEARMAVEGGEAIFIDVRSHDSFANGHIPAAFNVPLDEMQTQLDSLNPDQWYIPYCT
jgi:hypothetical protein